MIKLAQGQPINLYDGGQYKGFGSLGLEGPDKAEVVFQRFISSAIGFISIIAIIWFVIIIITGGIAYMGAGADSKVAEGAKKKISNGLIGLLITIFGIFIINLVGQIFNLPSILNLPDLFGKLKV